MKWMRFTGPQGEGFGTLQGDAVSVFEGSMFDSPTPTGQTLPLAEVRWLTPCTPSKIIGLWNNFRAAAEKNGWSQPSEPLYFLKSPSSAAAHRQGIPVPASYDGRVIYEGELGVVIGRRTKAASLDEARQGIFGYTCANDVTALELLGRDPSFPQWTRAKSFDGFAAFGPVIETEVDPASLVVRTLVGGRERQNYPVADMFFSPAEIVSRISQDMTLEPGDLILCGTSLGSLPMKPGSTVEVAVEGVGTLSNVYG